MSRVSAYTNHGRDICSPQYTTLRNGLGCPLPLCHGGSTIVPRSRKNRHHLLVYCVHGEERSDKLLRLLPAKIDGMIPTDHCVDDGYVLDLHR